MTRSERLLQLIAILRRHRYPVSGRELSQELDISLRTLYRDIATLQLQGAEIDGEAGVGYVLKPGFMLPPLMFSIEELEALVLGSRFVASRTDSPLANAAYSALAKITAVLPTDLKRVCDDTALLMAPSAIELKSQHLPDLRLAIRSEVKIMMDYQDLRENITTRKIWPFGIAFFDHVRVVLAYCEKRQAYRHFRLDRILKMDLTDERYPRRRRALLKDWRDELSHANDPAPTAKN
ncbi:helix-turn-helix transcriptional regulator [Bartonella sp. LJL80]